MSLLLSEGHVDARRYPLWMLWDETRIVRARNNAAMVTNAVLLQMAAGSLFSKEAGKAFEKVVKGLQDGD